MLSGPELLATLPKWVNFPAHCKSLSAIEDQIEIDLADLVCEMAFYIQHRAGPSAKDWFRFRHLLSLELRWLSKSLDLKGRLFRFRYTTDDVLQVEKNQEHMPVHHQLLQVLRECGLQPSHWDVVLRRMFGWWTKERLDDRCFDRDIILTKEMGAVVVTYCGYFGYPNTEKVALMGLVEALKKVRQMEPSLSGWVFGGFHDYMWLRIEP
ncbi:hypothetical protein BDD12DRAFT_822148 [Trichophaea hybrida]|nr:hypothetical protein BDD12DRAFT_822148 [Trichophaea hybrida]